MEQWSDPDPGSGIKHPGSATLVPKGGGKILFSENIYKRPLLFIEKKTGTISGS
jgi:hypothetical protein